jgi:hypothetical protein
MSEGRNGNIAKPMLGDVLLSTGKRKFYIPDYIKANAKTRAISKLRLAFEELIKHDKRFYGERTSEIFITLGTKKGERETKYYPKVRDSFYSHVTVVS